MRFNLKDVLERWILDPTFNFNNFESFGSNWESLVICIQSRYISCTQGYVCERMAYVTPLQTMLLQLLLAVFFHPLVAPLDLAFFLL